VRPCDLVANRHFVNSVVIGGSHVQTCDTAWREVECRRTVSPMVLSKILTKLAIITTSSTYRLIFSLCRREPVRRSIGRYIVLLIARRTSGRALSSPS
jgi:hypothetical protein